MTNKKSSKRPKGKPNISNWKGIEKNIFDYILSNFSYEIFYDIEYDYCFVLAGKGFYPTSPLDINKNKVVCNFFAKQSFFDILPDDIKNYILAHSL